MNKPHLYQDTYYMLIICLVYAKLAHYSQAQRLREVIFFCVMYLQRKQILARHFATDNFWIEFIHLLKEEQNLIGNIGGALAR